MRESFLLQDLYVDKRKDIIKSTASLLSCYVCKKELNGGSITAKELGGKLVFLCSKHYRAKPHQILLTGR